MKKIFFLAAIACFAYNVNAETTNETYDNFKFEIVDGVIQECKYSGDNKIYDLRIPATVSSIAKHAFSGFANYLDLVLNLFISNSTDNLSISADFE